MSFSKNYPEILKITAIKSTNLFSSILAARITIRAGSDYVSYGSETKAQLTYVHPNYTSSNLYADIAVIKVIKRTT